MTDPKCAVCGLIFASAFNRLPISSLIVVIGNTVAANKLIAFHPKACLEGEFQEFYNIGVNAQARW